MFLLSKTFRMEKSEGSEEQKTARENQALLDEIKKSESAMSLAYMNFEHASEPILIDCTIYELNAAQLRYQYLLEKARKKGIIVHTSSYFC